MADDAEPTLPRFPHLLRPSRKRARPGIFDGTGGSGSSAAANLVMLNTSSDPAVFSSDDDPALDNYLPDPAAGEADGGGDGGSRRSRKKKKRYVGAWFAQHPASADSGLGGEGDHEGNRERSPVRVRNALNLPLISSPLKPQPPPLPQPQPQPAKKRAFERQYDSGVWMESAGVEGEERNLGRDLGTDIVMDGADGQDEKLARRAFDSSPPPPPSRASSSSSQLSLAPPRLVPALNDFPPLPPRQRRVFQRVPSLAVNSAEQGARRLIQECIEAGEEEVSLIGLGLTMVSNATIEPLSGLVPIPIVTEGVAFEQKEPSLKLFLSNNNLTRLPGALFALEHLTVLSLRGNGLTELSPAIGKLTNLRTLNVSLNALRYMPAELLPLIHATGQGGRLTELLVHPNRYVSCAELQGNEAVDDDDDDDNAETKPHVRQQGAKPCRVARTPVCYKDSNGNVLSAFTMKPMRSELSGDAEMLATEDVATTPAPPWSTLSRQAAARSDDATELTASRVPTLLEMALEACYSAPQLPQLAAMLPRDAPPQLGRQLGKAFALRESGGCSCCVCGNRQKPLVAPMTEWVEWWAFAQADLNVAYSSAGRAAPTPAQPVDEEAHAADAADATEAVPVGQMEVLPFSFRGCSWGCVPAATS